METAFEQVVALKAQQENHATANARPTHAPNIAAGHSGEINSTNPRKTFANKTV